jgi:hypothetical protein
MTLRRTIPGLRRADSSLRACGVREEYAPALRSSCARLGSGLVRLAAAFEAFARPSSRSGGA